MLAAAVGIGAARGSEKPYYASYQIKQCSRLLPRATVGFSGLYPTLEGKVPIAEFRPGQIVEINPYLMSGSDAREYIRQIKSVGARVSIYVIGGHCEIDRDCDHLPATVRLGTTGSWYWDRLERRILNITHPAVLARLAAEIENGWRLGANYIRIDNLHHPAGSTHRRTAGQMQKILGLAQTIESRLHASGVIEAERVTGLAAHNNLVVWRQLLEQGKLQRPPAYLTSERTAQLAAFPHYEADTLMKTNELTPSDVPDIPAGRQLAEHFQIPYVVVEFRRSHDLARIGKTYELPQSYVDKVHRLAGVSEVMVMASEDQYAGRGDVLWGRGPKLLSNDSDSSSRNLRRGPCHLLALPTYR